MHTMYIELMQQISRQAPAGRERHHGRFAPRGGRRSRRPRGST